MKATDNYLRHIKKAITRIAEYTLDMTIDQFKKNHLVQDGVIRQLEIIGEAAAHLDAFSKNEYPDIPWQQMKDLRNILAHEYWEVDFGLIWRAVSIDCPNLKKALKK